MAKRYDEGGIRLTDCCGAYSTFHDEDLCCRKCHNPVNTGEGDGLEKRKPAKAKPAPIKLGATMREIPLREADRKSPEHTSPFEKARRIFDAIDTSGLDAWELGALAAFIIAEAKISPELAAGMGIVLDSRELDSLRRELHSRIIRGGI